MYVDILLPHPPHAHTHTPNPFFQGLNMYSYYSYCTLWLQVTEIKGHLSIKYLYMYLQGLE